MKKALSVALAAVLFSLSVPAFAGDGTSGDTMSSVGRKFGRGLWNILSSPAEIPCTTGDEISNRGAAAGTFTGLGLGIAYMCRRILVGATEVGTFMIPMEATIPPVCSDKPVSSAV